METLGVQHRLDDLDDGLERDDGRGDLGGRVAAVQHVHLVGEVPHIPARVDRPLVAEDIPVALVNLATALLFLHLEGSDHVSEVQVGLVGDHDRHVPAGATVDDDVGAGAVAGTGEARDLAAVALGDDQGQGTARTGDLLHRGRGLEVGLGLDEEVLVLLDLGGQPLHEPATADLFAVLGDDQDGHVLQGEVLARLQLVQLGVEGEAGPVEDLGVGHVALAHFLDHVGQTEGGVAALGVHGVDVLQEGGDGGVGDHVEVLGDEHGARGGLALLALGVVVELAATDADQDVAFGVGVGGQEGGGGEVLDQDLAQELVGVGSLVVTHHDVLAGRASLGEDDLLSHGVLHLGFFLGLSSLSMFLRTKYSSIFFNKSQ